MYKTKEQSKYEGSLYTTDQNALYIKHNLPFELRYSVLFRGITEKVNKHIAEALCEGKIIQLPSRMGKLMMFKKIFTPKIKKDGILVTYKKVDWKATKQLWEDDEEAKTEKILLKYSHNERHFLKWIKPIGIKNFEYMDIKIGYSFAKQLGKAINEGKCIAPIEED